MNILDAVHATVRNYPGGSESLAPRMITRTEDGKEKAMSAAVLRNKANPNNTTHHLTLAEADQIMGLTGDHRILHALAAEHGYVLQPAAADEAGCVLQSILTANTTRGEFDRVLQEALQDNLITSNEMKLVTEAGASHVAAYVALIARLRAMSQQGATR